MSTPYDKQLDELMAVYRERSAQIAATQEKMLSVVGTATSRQRVVSVTVGARGDVTELSFPTQRYRKMPPAELAAVLTATIAEARANVAEQVTELMGGLVPGGMPSPFGAQGDRLPDEPPSPQSILDHVMGRFGGA